MPSFSSFHSCGRCELWPIYPGDNKLNKNHEAFCVWPTSADESPWEQKAATQVCVSAPVPAENQGYLKQTFFALGIFSQYLK